MSKTAEECVTDTWEGGTQGSDTASNVGVSYTVAPAPGANDSWNPYAIVPISQVRRWEAIEALARELTRVAQEPGLCKERCAAIMEARRLGLMGTG